MSYPPPNPGYPGYPPPGGGMPQPSPAPAGLPYPAQPYPSQPGYPPTGSYPPPNGSYPPPGGSYSPGGSYPPAGGAYPPAGGMPMPEQAPYPTASPYQPQPAGAPYPSVGAGGAAYPPGPSGSFPAPASNSPYPAAGGSSYPSSPAGNSSQHAPNTTQSAGHAKKPAKVKSKGGPDSTTFYVIGQEPGDCGTIKPLTSGFNPEADATQIRNCLKSAFINETIIVNILPHRSNAQRQKVRSLYKTMYGKDLLQDLRSRLTGDFESVTAALLMTPPEYDAYLINKAIQGAGTDEDALIQILCTRNNAQMNEIIAVYKETFKASIEQHMQGDTSGHFMRMLISLANGARQENQGVNQQKAEEDAKKLYKAGAGRLGTDESTFNSIFVSQSFEQLRAVFGAYKRLYNKDMEKVIKSEMSGDLENGMKTIVRFTLDKHAYWANVLYKSMKGLGTDEKTLIRTLVSRSEVDLEQIKSAFNNIKGESKPLAHWVKKETSGPFRDMLLHIIGS